MSQRGRIRDRPDEDRIEDQALSREMLRTEGPSGVAPHVFAHDADSSELGLDAEGYAANLARWGLRLRAARWSFDNQPRTRGLGTVDVRATSLASDRGPRRRAHACTLARPRSMEHRST